jgi:hypothetical protein
VDWAAVAGLAACLVAASSLTVAVAVLREVRGSQAWQRITLSLDTLWRFDNEWRAPEMSASRSAAAAGLLDGRPTAAVGEVLDFFDEIAFLIDRGALDEETVWYRFYWPMASYWFASQDYVQRMRHDNASSWEHLARVMPRLATLESQRRTDHNKEGIPNQKQIEDFLNAEIEAGRCDGGGDQEVHMTPL